MTEFARDLYNPFVALVLGLVLDIASREVDQMSTQSSRTCRRHPSIFHLDHSPLTCHTLYRLASAGPVSLSEISRAYDALHREHPERWLDVSRAFAPTSLPGDDAFPPAKKKSITFILHVCEVLAGIDQWGMSTREMFLRQDGEGQHAKWIVDYAILGRAMKRATVESIIRDKIGDKALRCWRIMEAKGKLDEKHASYSSMFNAFVCREANRAPLSLSFSRKRLLGWRSSRSRRLERCSRNCPRRA